MDTCFQKVILHSAVIWKVQYTMLIFWILRRQDFDHLSIWDMSKELKNPSRVQKPDAKVPPSTHNEEPDELWEGEICIPKLQATVDFLTSN